MTTDVLALSQKLHDAGKKLPSGLSINAKGEVTYRNSAFVNPDRKPFKMAALKPRIDKPGDTVKRLEEHIYKQIGRYEEKEAGRFHAMRNQPACAGFTFVATDGHRALLQPDPESLGGAHSVGKITSGYQPIVINDADFHLALKRALVMTGDNLKDAVYFTVFLNTLTLASRDADCGDFQEDMPVTADFVARFCLNGKYLEPALGEWPLTIWVKDEESSLIIVPPGDDWRYVVMPTRGGWSKEDTAEFEAVKTALAPPAEEPVEVLS